MEGFAVCHGRAGHRKRVVFLGESGFSVCYNLRDPRLILFRHEKLWNSRIGGLPV